MEEQSNGWTSTNHTFARDATSLSGRCLLCAKPYGWHFHVPEED